jgi:hypothetical protein
MLDRAWVGSSIEPRLVHQPRESRPREGPAGVGSFWQTVSKVAGISTELTYTLEQLTDEQIVLVGRNDTATSTEIIDVAAVRRDRAS